MQNVSQSNQCWNKLLIPKSRFVCAMRATDHKIIRLANYPSPVREDERTIKIWEAARATAASPMYFDPISIGRSGEQLLDGGLGANNPVREVLQAAQELWPQGVIGDRIGCLVSIGTGVQPVEPISNNFFQLAKALVSQTLGTEATAESFLRENRNMFLDNRYFRFTVPQGLDSVALDSLNEMPRITAATRSYINTAVAYQQLNYAAARLANSQRELASRTVENESKQNTELPRRPSLTKPPQTIDEVTFSTQSGSPESSAISIRGKESTVETTPGGKELDGIVPNLASCFAQDPTLRILCVSALERVGDERFEINFARLLRAFAKNLLAEISDTWQTYTARMVWLSHLLIIVEANDLLLDILPGLYSSQCASSMQLFSWQLLSFRC
jgi:hypothetical protein